MRTLEETNTENVKAQDIMVYKYPYHNPLFQENDLLLDWPFSNRVLITAYDLYKNEALIHKLKREGRTLKEYFRDFGLRKEVKIFADTGIFEIEMRKARMKLKSLIPENINLSQEEIFDAYDIIDPDVLIAPDEIILKSDSSKIRREKLSMMKQYLDNTIDRFGINKTIATVQGLNDLEITDIISYINEVGISKIARGGLLPLRRVDKPLYYDILTKTQNIANQFDINFCHAFGLSGVYALGDFFVHNRYNSIDTSLVYWVSAEREFITPSGYQIPVRKANFDWCTCRGCLLMNRSKRYTTSGKFVTGLYYHNAKQIRDIVDWIFTNPIRARTRFSKYIPSSYYKPPKLDPEKAIKKSWTMYQDTDEIFVSASTFKKEKQFQISNSNVHKKRKIIFNKAKKYKKTARILVISSCSKSKKKKPPVEAIFPAGTTRQYMMDLTRKYQYLQLPAQQMYTGSQHDMTIRALKRLNNLVKTDHLILSAAYGLISPDDMIIPYDATFNNDENTIEQRKNLEIDKQIRRLDLSQYSMIFEIMPESYREVLNLENYLENFEGEVINFGNQGRYTIDEFRAIHRKNPFRMHLGRYYHVQGQILINFSMYLRRTRQVKSFVSFWHDSIECECTQFTIQGNNKSNVIR